MQRTMMQRRQGAQGSRRGQRCSSGCGRRVPAVQVRAEAAAVAVKQQAKQLAAATKVQLGSSDLQVSTVCLGTMTFGKQNTEAEAHQQLSYSWDLGINFLDTAEMYPVPTEEKTTGQTDRFISTWLKHQKRDSVVLATKVAGYAERLSYLRTPRETTRLNRQQILASVDASLKRLGTDYIDLLQLHWPDRYVPLWGGASFDKESVRPGAVPFEETLGALAEVVKAGKVRYVGVSNETSYGVGEFVRLAQQDASLPKIVSIQNAYSLLNRMPYDTNLAETCYYHQVGLMAYSPLAGGSLSGKYNQATVDPKARFHLFPGYMERYNRSLVKEAVGEYTKVAAKYGLTCAQLALAWCKTRWQVNSTIIGATTLEQLKEDLEAFDVDLPKECLDDVEAVFKRYRDPALI